MAAGTRSTKSGQERVNFGKIKLSSEYPDLLEIQLKSFQEFFQLETTPENRGNEGLYRVFQENFPITDARNIFVLEFLDYFVDPPRYSIAECVQRGLTYSVPLKSKLRLSCNDEEHVDFQTIVQDVFLGNIPYMTPKGTFVINGAERVIVGVNKYSEEEEQPDLLRIDGRIEIQQKKALKKLRDSRDKKKWEKALSAMQSAAGTEENLMPYIVTAAKALATTGEISNTFREVFGEYRPKEVF